MDDQSLNHAERLKHYFDALRVFMEDGFALIGLKVDWSLGGIERMEQTVRQAHCLGAIEFTPATILPFALYIGDFLVRSIRGAQWDYDVGSLEEVAIIFETRERHKVKIFPFKNMVNFIHDPERRPSAIVTMACDAARNGLPEIEMPRKDGEWSEWADASAGYSLRLRREEIPKSGADSEITTPY